MTPTCACGRPVKDNARLCAGCTDRLARDLGDIGALTEELTTTRLRQSRTGGQATGVLSRSHERPLAWNEKAAEAAEVLRSTVVAWVRVVLEERGGRTPDDTAQAMSAFLLGQLEWLRHHPAADECADEIGHAVQLAYRAVDIAPGRVYVGPCDPDGEFGDPCLTDLYARQGALAVVCPDCQRSWGVAERRAYLLELAGDRLVTAADLSRFLTVYGEPVTQERVRQWVAREQLTPHGWDQARRPLYRVSEAVAVLANARSRRKSA
jgi:hypothetical protein